MDLDVTPEWDFGPDSAGEASAVQASSSGAGPMGFTGAGSKRGATPAGLTALVRDGLGEGPRAPMMPSTWNPDEDR
jgi:PPE-repeat protein